MLSANVHGHDVIALVEGASAPFTRATLTAEVVRLWGPEATFYTCSAEGLTAAQLLDFLLERGKLVDSGGELSVIPGRVCPGE